MKKLSDDEVSDLSECLWDACKEAERAGTRVTIRLLVMSKTCCPFGALLGGEGFPGPTTVANETGIPREDVLEFMKGFAWPTPELPDSELRPMTELGFLFRKQSEAEGFC